MNEKVLLQFPDPPSSPVFPWERGLDKGPQKKSLVRRRRIKRKIAA